MVFAGTALLPDRGFFRPGALAVPLAKGSRGLGEFVALYLVTPRQYCASGAASLVGYRSSTSEYHREA